MSAKELASYLLSKLDNINELSNINYNYLISIKGIGKMKAASLLATIELGKRINNKLLYLNDIKLNQASLVFEYFKNKLCDKKQEHFYCIYLDNAKKVIKEKLLFIGTINFSIVHPREVFKEAYLLSASAIICVHNHPSGNLKPSNEDIEITKRLIEIGDLLGIKVLDHIIVGEDNYYSFLENEVI
jgi:DNA repair protein RadC